MPEVIVLEKKLDLRRIGEVLQILSAGGTFLYPTDTVYGLGCDATNSEALEKIFSIKGRPKNRPLSVMVDQLATISSWVEINSNSVNLIAQNFLPGALTLVLKTKIKLNPLLTGGSDTLGVRIPKNHFCLEICRRWGKPIVTTSANFSGGRSAIKVDEIPGDIKNQVDLIVDGGEIKSGVESTVVDLTGIPPRILREGFIKREEISKVIKQLT